MPHSCSLPLLVLALLPTLLSINSQPSQPNAGRQGGEWRLLQASVGISAMHMQLLHDNRVVLFDRTDFGRSNLSLPDGRCRYDSKDTVLKTDCSAHSVLYDVITNTFRPLMVLTDTWCSSGAVSPDGDLVQTGGYNDGDRAVRSFTPCGDGSCDWVEFPNYLSRRRWYATDQILPDGRIIVIGGRRQFSYEFYPKNDDNRGSSSFLTLHFLIETRDENENNLYPFVHLLPDGNLFVFANTRCISLNYRTNTVVREFPSIPVRVPRNYPSSGSSVMLPIDENKDSLDVEILICGGAPTGSYTQALQGNFIRASSSCGRLKVTDKNPSWAMENMPVARVMGDMLLLPTGNVLIINGVEFGTAGWELGRSPVTRPLIYCTADDTPTGRFSIMAPSPRPRLYHSTAALLHDGRILIGGSNPHRFYNFTDVNYPTDLSLEAYLPPYLSPEHDKIRPRILSADQLLRVGQTFSITFQVAGYLEASSLSARIVSPPFTTHSLSMNLRMVVLKSAGVSRSTSDKYVLNVAGPSKAEIAPPGYYMLFVVNSGIPSSAVWIKILSH
ncbi:hypothetical protein MLD38_017865 [Melastoma candidum]|uniref:Uncharacterized protein n=1 Tax=Melastoma candidum TaxID=119954 RepID=A0ACB9QV47_9MYRT|nr:hypothetical protein MLD38_017865 [Melastoma candidum]